MQTDILLKQVLTSFTDLKAAMDKFEKHPNTHYADQLHTTLNASNKLVAAYTVLKEQKDVSPELDLHLKIMSVEEPVVPQPPVEVKKEPVVEIQKEESKPEPVVEVKKEPVVEVKKELPKEEPVVEAKPVVTEEKKAPVPEPVVTPEKEKTPEPIQVVQAQQVAMPVIPKDIPKITVSINDKFRLINELFTSNANEYNIAIEQLNNVASKEEADAYLKGLKNIYNWDEENEMVKKMYTMNQKRFS